MPRVKPWAGIGWRPARAGLATTDWGPMMEVEGKVLGGRSPSFEGWSVPAPVPADGGEIRLRDLIGRVVRAEVVAFRERQEERKLARFLSADEIRRGATRGKVAMGGRTLVQEVDEDRAVSAALTAFEDGLYLVLVDDREVRGLDAKVDVGEETRVTFLRLALLGGG